MSFRLRHFSIQLTICFLGLLWSTPGFPGVIHLAYTANLNGNLETCHCGGNNLGGMVQLKAAVDSLFRRYPDLILLDTGDFLTTYSMPEVNQLMWRLLHQLPFAAISPGDQEFVEGWKFFREHIRTNSLPLVNSNLIFPERDSLPSLQRSLILKSQGYRIAILGIVPRDAFEFISVPELRTLPVDSILQVQLEKLPRPIDLVVLLLHDSYRHCTRLFRQFPEIDIIIAGHTQEQGEIRLGKHIVVQPGVDGEYIGLLTIHPESGTDRYENRFIPVSPDFGEDREFKKLVEILYQQLEQQKTTH